MTTLLTALRRLLGGDGLPEGFPGALEADERVLAVARTADGAHVVVTSWGLWLPDESTLIGGDMIMNYPLGGVRMPLRPPTVDWAQAKVTIQKASQMSIKNLMIGHGKPLIGDASEKLRAFAATFS